MGPLSGKNILVGVGGGIAAYKCPDLVRRLKEYGADVRVVMTGNAGAFITALTLQAVSGHPVRSTLLDSEAESGMDHIDLARWADHIVIAPATANLAARLAHGFADDLLTTLCLASDASLWLAPAMNRVMWSKAVCQENFDKLRESGAVIVGPAEGNQACGEVGAGRMVEPVEIVQRIAGQAAGKALEHIHVLITAGPTWEALDPVRGLTNLSSGKMGYAMAAAFAELGARVTLISGPCHLTEPAGVHRIDIQSAQDMFDAVHREISTQGIFIAVAAVADYRPENLADHKIKKGAHSMDLRLVKNPDILSSVAQLSDRPFCVGFAAETQDVAHYAKGKLAAKGLDMIAANLVGGSEGGFMTDDNTLLVLTHHSEQEIGPASKTEVARQFVQLIIQEYDHQHSS